METVKRSVFARDWGWKGRRKRERAEDF